MLLALFLEINANRVEKVLIDNVQDRINTIRRQAFGVGRTVPIKTSLFREIVKRMQAFGLITMEIMPQRFIDNVFLQTTIFEDEIVNGFQDFDFVRIIANSNPILSALLKDRDNIDDCRVGNPRELQKADVKMRE